MSKWKRQNNDLQNITHKTKDRATRFPLNVGFIKNRVQSTNKIYYIIYSTSNFDQTILFVNY